jgi:hypothetical protein
VDAEADIRRRRKSFAQGVTVKLVALAAVPPGVVTVILPVTAPTGTVVLI